MQVMVSGSKRRTGVAALTTLESKTEAVAFTPRTLHLLDSFQAVIRWQRNLMARLQSLFR